MTGPIRDALRTLGRLGAKDQRPGHVQLPPAELVVRFDDVPDGAAQELADALKTMVGQRMRELAIPRTVTSRAELATRDPRRLAVAIDGRPLAVLDNAPQSSTWVHDTVRAVDLALLRRLSVLLGDGPTTVSHYLVDNGVALPVTAPELSHESTPVAEHGELVIDRLAAQRIVVEVAEAVLRNTQPGHARALVDVRTELYARTGVQYPDVRIEAVPSPSHSLRIRCNDVLLPETPVPADGGWQHVVTALEEPLQAHAAWFLALSDVRETRERMMPVVPDFMAVSAQVYSDELLSACLRELLRSSESIRNLPRVLWLMIEAGPSWGTGSDLVRLSEVPLLSGEPASRDPELIASGLRRRINEEAWRAGVHGDDGPMVSLPHELEESLVRAGDPVERADAEWRAVLAVDALEPNTVIVAHAAEGVRPVRYALQACRVQPRVIASQELPPDVDLPPLVAVAP